jgi:NhaA family Na+:H+ antiporter
MTTARPRPLSALRAFLRSESAGGLLLMGSAALALLVANSPCTSMSAASAWATGSMTG